MASALFQALLQKNSTIFDTPLAQLGKLLVATNQAKLTITNTIEAHKATKERARALKERCDRLLIEMQELGDESVKIGISLP